MEAQPLAWFRHNTHPQYRLSLSLSLYLSSLDKCFRLEPRGEPRAPCENRCYDATAKRKNGGGWRKERGEKVKWLPCDGIICSGGEDLRGVGKQTTPARDRSIRVIEGGMDDGAV